MTLREEYMHERKRLQSAIYRGKKMGYTFEKDILPPLKDYVTQEDVDLARAMTPQDLYELATYTTESGEVISGTTQRKIQKEQGYKNRTKNKQEEPIEDYPTVDLFEQILESLSTLSSVGPKEHPRANVFVFNYANRENYLVQLFYDTYYSMDSKDFYEYFTANEQKIKQLIESLVYYDSKQEEYEHDFMELANVLNGGALTPTQMDLMEDFMNGIG